VARQVTSDTKANPADGATRETIMKRDVALVTPTHRNDIERFALLCDSIEQRVDGYAKHYVIVNDDDVALFAQWSNVRRVIVPGSQLLPRWLKLLPFVLRKNRRVWWSFRTKPVHGWHVQQILKIGAALQLPEQRYCLIDSDNVFVRPFDLRAYAGAEKTPLYVEHAAISADAPLHGPWTRNCTHLLGPVAPTTFPADDYVGNGIVWDKQAVRDMTSTIERVTGKSWAHALCSTRDFSEYLLYGHFVRNSPPHLAAHELTTKSLANAYWDDTPLNAAAVKAMFDTMTESQVALCIESFSHTPVSIIRDVVALPEGLVGRSDSPKPTASRARQLDAQLH
jgi:hypothetical protein